MDFKRRISAFGLGLAPLLIAGCAMWPSAHVKHNFPYMTPEARLARMEPMNTWRVEGGICVQVYDGHHVLPLTVARFTWKNFNKRHAEIRVVSVRNNYDINVVFEYNDIMVWRDFKYPFHVKNLQIYMYNNLGWSVPVKSLPFWLRGIPAHAPFVAHYNAYGLIDSMEQQGWTIRYTSYTDMDNYDLPRRITLSRPGMDIIIVLNRWDTMLLNRSVLPL